MQDVLELGTCTGLGDGHSGQLNRIAAAALWISVATVVRQHGAVRSGSPGDFVSSETLKTVRADASDRHVACFDLTSTSTLLGRKVMAL